MCIYRQTIISILLIVTTEAVLAVDQQADTVYLNGVIYTVDSNKSRAEAVAIRDGKFLYVGSNTGVKKFIGTSTRRVDLVGKMVMPGIHDAHIHVVMGAEETGFGCRFSEMITTPGEITAALKTCIENDMHKLTGWITGGYWDVNFMNQPEVFNKSILDAVAPDIPVILWSNAHHDALMNSKAFELLGVTSETPDPEGGQIVRDTKSGEPSGILIEQAAYQFGANVPHPPKKLVANKVKEIISELNHFGILGFKDAATPSGYLAVYKHLDDNKELTLRVAATVLMQPTFMGPPEDTVALIKNRGKYSGTNLGTDFAKLFLDGAPPGKTAAFLDPYLPDDTHGSDYRGHMIDLEQLKKDVIMLDGMGVTVKMHAAGDASVQAALNAVEATRKRNGDSGLLHEIAHASFIHPDDMPRFAQLGVAADFSPVIWHPHPVMDYLQYVLEAKLVKEMWPIRSSVDSGAIVIAGSDWPSVGAVDANPWKAMEAMVTRKHPTGDFPGVLGAEQKVPLEEVLKIYTINGAKAIRVDNITGSIETGKSADLIVLDRNLFDIPEDEISETQVLSAVFKGRMLFSQ